MEKKVFIYFGDDLFHKLESFTEEHLSFGEESVKYKTLFKSLSNNVIDNVYLGWSYIIYRIENKLYHAGYPNLGGESTEVLKVPDINFDITCGSNKAYAFSNDNNIISYSTQNLDDTLTYVHDTKQRIKTLATGECYSVILFQDGTVSLLKLHEKTPLISLNIRPIISEVACGKEHVLFLSENGQVFSFGCGSKGQLGHGSIENQDEPTLLEALDGIKMKAIACGGWHSTSISYAGDLYIWGWNESGQLGFPCAELCSRNHAFNEVETVCCFPKIVEFGDEKQILSVSCGTRHTAVLTDDSEVWSWGWNEYGQLGHGKYSLCDKPCMIPLPSKFAPKKIECAFWSTLIIGTLHL